MEFSPDYYSNLENSIPRGKFRTRFAPSPTGYLHVGGLRTALYAYLLAKKEGGSFILRIEDTDQERFVEGACDIIYDTLTTNGLTYDEGPNVGGPVGPYIQSERKEIYSAYTQLIIERGGAYRCFCDKEILEQQRKIHDASRIPHKYDGRCSRLTGEEIASRLRDGAPYVVRQKMLPQGTSSFDDLVFGRIEIENSTLEDQVLLKRDGMPTYNFANVVDDHLMGITHVIRGSEYLSSTPKYNLLYEGFGWETPEYIHCSPVMKDATHKLSKRTGDASFNDLIEKGYLKEAVLNYIALLGWSPGGTEEKFTLSELIETFDVKGISKSPSIFDYDKLGWLNGEYLRAMSDEEFHRAALPYIRKGVRREVDTFYLAELLKARCETLSEISGQLDFIDSLPDYSCDLFVSKKMKTDAANSKEALTHILPVLEGISDWQPGTIHDAMHELISRLELKNGRILWPLRVAASGKAFTPGGGIEICALLGKEETLGRIRLAIEKLSR